jgi:drug/metabolite transporter (DMT)-like permease
MSNPPSQNHLADVAGPLFMLSSALLFTVLNLIIKLLDPRFRVWDIGFYRFAGGLILILLIFGRHANPYRGRPIWLLLLRGCTGTMAFLALISAIRLLPISTAMVIFYTFPAMAAGFARLIYGERISAMALACIAATIVGVAVFFNFRLEGGGVGATVGHGGSRFCRADRDLDPGAENGQQFRDHLPLLLYHGADGHPAGLLRPPGDSGDRP